MHDHILNMFIELPRTRHQFLKGSTNQNKRKHVEGDSLIYATPTSSPRVADNSASTILMQQPTNPAARCVSFPSCADFPLHQQFFYHQSVERLYETSEVIVPG